jgi:hypothetical protein
MEIKSHDAELVFDSWKLTAGIGTFCRLMELKSQDPEFFCRLMELDSHGLELVLETWKNI